MQISICDVWWLQHELDLNSFEILHADDLWKVKIEGKYENKFLIQGYHLDTTVLKTTAEKQPVQFVFEVKDCR